MEIRHKNWNKFFNMEWKSEYDNLRKKIPVTYLINPAIKLSNLK
jgi:hypothetical protein